MGGNVVVKLNLNSSGYSAEMAKAQRTMKAFGDSAKEAGHGTVTQMQAASASIRLIEGDMTRNVRAVEKFITTIPGVGVALQAAFPVVGLLAFAGIVSKIVTEVIRAKEALAQVRNVANESFEALTEGAHKNADALRVTNDRLEAQIAIMEHKPVNNMALALDEARLRADELATSLNKDYDAFKKVIEQGQANTLNNLLGNGVDKGLGGGMQDQLANIRTLARQQRDELRAGNQPAADATGKKLRAAQDASISFADQQTGVRNEIANAGDPDFKSSYLKKQGMNLDAIAAFKDLVAGQVDVADQQQRNTTDEVTKQRLEAAKAGADAMKKQQDELLKLFENQERQQNAFNKLTVNEEIQFWSDRLSAFTMGSDLYLKVQDKIYSEISKRPDLTKTNSANQAKAGKSTVEGNDILGEAQRVLTQLTIQDLERQNKAAEQYNKIATQGAEIMAHNKGMLDAFNVSIGLEEGTISKLAAAQEMARIHTQQHADAIAAVNRELETQINLINSDPNPNLSSEDRSRAIQNAQDAAGNKRSEIDGGYAVTQAQDNANIYGDTIPGAVKDSLNTMVQNFNDMAATLKTVIPQTIDSMNDNITKAITGHGSKGDFGRTFTQAGDSLLRGALQKGEGALLGGLMGTGGKKAPTGAQGDAIHTIIDSPGGSPGGNQWFRPFMGGQQDPKGQQDGQGKSGSGFWGQLGSSLLKSLFKSKGDGSSGGGDGGGGGGGDEGDGGGFDSMFQGAFANGGNFMAGRPMLVGERGPEMLVPKSSGTIIPNHSLGGDNSTHFHIDARGATDPAAIHAAVMRAAPHIAASAVQANRSMAKRTPQGR